MTKHKSSSARAYVRRCVAIRVLTRTQGNEIFFPVLTQAPTMESCYPLHRVSVDIQEVFSRYMLEQIRQRYPTARIIETIENGAYMISVCGYRERVFSDGDLLLMLVIAFLLITLMRLS